jgi:orotate phosphoribosyltransferase
MEPTTTSPSSPPSLDGIFGWIVLTALGLATVVFVLDSVGFLPRWLQKFVYRNRSAQTIEVLKDLGFEVEKVKRENRAAKIPEKRSADKLEEAAKGLTEPITIRKKLIVGRVDAVETDSFIDLMGATCEPTKAIYSAQLLSSLWRNLIGAAGTKDVPDFDFVAAPKAGSPFIAYEFAKLHQKPLILHNEQPKFQSNDKDFVAFFDAAEKPKTGARALVVDDSTTGGRKAVDTIRHLREAGYIVSDFLVVFEPLTKKRIGRNAAERLSDVQVRLHSIIKTE